MITHEQLHQFYLYELSILLFICLLFSYFSMIKLIYSNGSILFLIMEILWALPCVFIIHYDMLELRRGVRL